MSDKYTAYSLVLVTASYLLPLITANWKPIFKGKATTNFFVILC